MAACPPGCPASAACIPESPERRGGKQRHVRAVAPDMDAAASAPALRYRSAAGRWVVAAAVLGSGVAFLDGTVVNVALPAIRADLGGGLSGLQWVVDAYLLFLGSLLVLGGSLGDLYGRRRVFIVGLVAFSAASLLCGLAPSIGVLIAARAVQGVAGALLVPASLALISATFAAADRGAAIGAWSGLSGVTTALGPFVGGYLIEAVSWRLVFLINVPIVAATVWVAARHVPETRDAYAARRPDVLGGTLLAGGLGLAVFALIEKQRLAPTLFLGLLGAAVAVLVAFALSQTRVRHPMVPPAILRSLQFDGANLVTLVVYAALGGAMFFLSLELQGPLGYSPIEAGAAFLPVTVLMLVLSSTSGRIAGRIGPRWQMTLGPVVVGAGMALMTRVVPGRGYLDAVLPAACVLGIGLSVTVAPLTAAVLGAVEEGHAGVASGINNAVARLAGLIAIALLPVVAGLERGAGFVEGFQDALWISAAACVVGALIALATIRRSVPLRNLLHPGGLHGCEPAETRRELA